MTSWQKTIKYLAMAFAIFLTVSIFAGIFGALGAFSFIDNIFDKEEVQLGELKTYTVSDNIKNIEIDVGAADLTVVTGDKFYVESNLSNLTVKEDGKSLEISSEKGFDISLSFVSGGTLKIYIPNGFVFDEANIDTGAGQVSIEELSANELELNFGAGEANIEKLNAFQNAEISGGAGEVTIGGGTLNNAEISMGVGEFNLAGELLGRGDVSLGVGESNINLLGNKNDYTLNVTKGLGEANVDGQSIAGSEVFGSGKNKIDISGGVGEVNITFNEN